MTDPDKQGHWERVYAARKPDEVSWYQPVPSRSLELIRSLAPAPARVLDVGGGASTLVDHLLAGGYDVGVLDIAGGALEESRARLGERAADVEWFVGDVTSFATPHPWDVWHDRAVFHFLVDEGDRSAYRAVLSRSLAPGGIASKRNPCGVCARQSPSRITVPSTAPSPRHSASMRPSH